MSGLVIAAALFAVVMVVVSILLLRRAEEGHFAPRLSEQRCQVAEALASETPDSDLLGLYIESLNETIDVNTTRVTAALVARVPETILLLLVIGVKVLSDQADDEPGATAEG